MDKLRGEEEEETQLPPAQTAPTKSGPDGPDEDDELQQQIMEEVAKLKLGQKQHSEVQRANPFLLKPAKVFTYSEDTAPTHYERNSFKISLLPVDKVSELSNYPEDEELDAEVMTLRGINAPANIGLASQE